MLRQLFKCLVVSRDISDQKVNQSDHCNYQKPWQILSHVFQVDLVNG
jgi:hypothetical protein